MRLAALSEIPDEWAAGVSRWSRMLRARDADAAGEDLPSRQDEYVFYQQLVGAWPAELSAGIDHATLDAFRQRLEAVMTKCMREAKLHTTWALPNAAYEATMIGFVRSALDPSRGNEFLPAFIAFQRRLAELGVRNSIVQTVLKLTGPGARHLPGLRSLEFQPRRS